MRKEVSASNYDFCGWVTKNDLKCADGKVIRHGAFRSNNGRIVPLVYQHNHSDITNVLGKVLLENRDDGVYGYGLFNETPGGQHAKTSVMHGDLTSMSIWANNLQQIGPDVTHGVIREVSLVLAGANPGAFIESVMSHGIAMEDGEDEGIFYTGESILIHSEIQHAEKEEDNMDEKEKKDPDSKGKTVKDVIDTMNDEQKRAMAIIVGQALADKKGEKEDDEDEKEDKEVKHNIFEGSGTSSAGFISHDDMKALMKDAKQRNSLREAIKANLEEGGILAHAMPTDGMEVSTENRTYGFNDPSMLFPDFRDLMDRPEWLSRNMDWVTKFFSKVHRTPFSRVRTTFADITEDEARAKGYITGKRKKEEVFTLLKRTVSPQTIYKMQKMDRDDLLDITGFDVIAWLKAEMRIMLNEEIARACLIGDGRSSSSEYKIDEAHVHPIISEPSLFNTKVIVQVKTGMTEDDIARAVIRQIIKSRKNYKGSGRPDFWTTEDTITDMLLLENKIGDRVYKTEAELATALRVGEIIPVEPMAGQKMTIGGNIYELLGVIVNVADYNIGADKGGDINSFDDFDIDFNQQKYLIETRISGALTKPFSALTILLDRGEKVQTTPPPSEGDQDDQGDQ